MEVRYRAGGQRTGTTAPQLIQVVKFGNLAYPLYLDGDVTRVIPLGGMPLADVSSELVFELDLERKIA
jgi:hypothetical protein